MVEKDRALQIKLAQLNAVLQVHIALIFGGVAGAIALIIFEYQLTLGNFPLLSFATFAIVLSGVFAVALSVVALVASLELRKCVREFKELK